MGTPVVATRHAGNAEGVVEGRTALLVDERDVPGLADAHCVSFIETPGRRRVLRRGRAVLSSRRISASTRQAAGLERLYDRARGWSRARRCDGGMRAGPEVDRRVGTQRHHLGAGRTGRCERPAADLRAAASLGVRSRQCYAHRALRRAKTTSGPAAVHDRRLCRSRPATLDAVSSASALAVSARLQLDHAPRTGSALSVVEQVHWRNFRRCTRPAGVQHRSSSASASNLMLGWLTRHCDGRVVLIVRHPGAVIESELRGDWQAGSRAGSIQERRHAARTDQVRYRRLLARSLNARRGAGDALGHREPVRHRTSGGRWRHGRALRAAEVVARRRMAAPVPALDLANVPTADARAKPSQQSAASRSAILAGSSHAGWMQRLTPEQVERIQGVLDEVGFELLFDGDDPAPTILASGDRPEPGTRGCSTTMNTSVAWQLAWALATVLVVYVLASSARRTVAIGALLVMIPFQTVDHSLRYVQRADGVRTRRDPAAERRTQGPHVARAGSDRARVPDQPVAGRPGADVVPRHLRLSVLLVPRRFPAGLQLRQAGGVRAYRRRHSAGD